MIKQLEDVMYQMSDFFMAPVLLLLALLFAYSLVSLGGFLYQSWQRRRYACLYKEELDNHRSRAVVKPVQGYTLMALVGVNPNISQDALDVAAFEELEGVRTVSRLAPMLGLIATMIPMGPALKSLADGNIQGISENLIVAFSAVIFGLIIASITFWIASVKKRWLANDLVSIAPQLKKGEVESFEESLREAA